MWEWVQTSRRTSSTPNPAWASARSSCRSLPLPPMPVSKRTMPSPASIAQAFPCGTPGQGSGNRSRQTPGSTFSVRAALARASPAIRASSQADGLETSTIWTLQARRPLSGLGGYEVGGVGASALAGVEAGDRGHVVLGQLEVEDLDVLTDSLLGCRLPDYHLAQPQV